MLPYAAYLRVYEPLTAFTPPEASSWAAYAESDRPSTPRERAPRRARRGACAASWGYLRPPPPPRRAPTPISGASRTCCTSARGRAGCGRGWPSRASAGHPGEADGAVRAARRRRADGRRLRQVQAAQRRPPCAPTSATHLARSRPRGSSPSTATSAGWSSTATRQPEGTTTTRNLIYVTSMAQARRRMARALQIIRRQVGEVAVTAEVEEVARWLEEFHPHSLVELDYGGIVHLMDDETLQADQSVAESRGGAHGSGNRRGRTGLRHVPAGDSPVAINTTSRIGKLSRKSSSLTCISRSVDDRRHVYELSSLPFSLRYHETCR